MTPHWRRLGEIVESSRGVYPAPAWRIPAQNTFVASIPNLIWWWAPDGAERCNRGELMI